VIDVLRGSKAKKVLKFRHERLSTYGIGQDHSKKQWFHLSRQFIQKGLLIQDMEFGGLRLADKALPVLKGNEKVFGMLTEEALDKIAEDPVDFDYDRDLFNELRKKRKELADKADVPPYVIFSDKTLREMAAFFPHAQDTLLALHGVGEVKCEKYGQYFLDIIQEYCRKNFIEERPKRAKRPRVQAGSSNRKKRHVLIGEAFDSGHSVEKIMSDYKIKQTTVLGHLFNYVREGNTIRSDGLLKLSTIPPEKIDPVIKAFKTHGTEYLKPVFDLFSGRFNYDDLAIVRLYCMTRDEQG
jgi:ATP-dependent DNA helicase RecQ